jgi:hypothetical protein
VVVRDDVQPQLVCAERTSGLDRQADKLAPQPPAALRRIDHHSAQPRDSVDNSVDL